MNPTDPGSLEEEVGELRARVQRLEEALYPQGILSERWKGPPLEEHGPVVAGTTAPVSAPAFAAAPPVPVSAASYPAPAAVSAAGTLPSFTHLASAATDPERSLESRIGSQWFNRIGILAVLIGMAWFLKFAIDNQWI